jgi:hypothetical protein
MGPGAAIKGSSGRHEAVVRLLLERDTVDPDAGDNSGQRALPGAA